MEKLKLVDLKKEAKERGILGYSKMARQTLIDILSLPEIVSFYDRSIDENVEQQQPCNAQQLEIARQGGVRQDDGMQKYLDEICKVPIPDAVLNNMANNRLSFLSKSDQFKHGIRKEIYGLMVLMM